MIDYNNYLSKKLIILLLSIVYIFLIIQKNKNNKYILNLAFIQLKNKKLNIKPYKISNYNKSHIRYNFQNIFNSIKLFHMNKMHGIFMFQMEY